MKNYLFIFFTLCLSVVSNNLFSQGSPSVSPLDNKLVDRFGIIYPINNLALNSKKTINGGNTVFTAAPALGCSAGYFDLYFEPGSFFDQNAQAAANLCQVFTDISNFISSPLSAPSNTLRINIYCGNTNTVTSPGALATASGFYNAPQGIYSFDEGIIDNVIYKAIVSGTDQFATLPAFLLPNNYYHGYVNANPLQTWNLSLTTSTINSNEYDFYSIMLHEVTHALGFASLIGPNGSSVANNTTNYYSRYDRFLYSTSGTPLLGSSTNSCVSVNLTFSNTINAIAPGLCVGSGADLTTCASAAQYSSANVTATVYTPYCFEPGSSLSHFEDMCTVPPSFSTACTATPALSNNNLYYVMSNAQSAGNCYIKRYLKPEERYVLCDLGYSVSSVYNSTVASAGYTYTGGSCSSTVLWGVDDGIQGGVYTFTSTGTSINIPITASIIANDSPGTTQMSCLDLLWGSATTAINSGSLTVTLTGGSGVIMLRYLPTDASGTLVGNATYIYVYFMDQSCSPPNACDLVQNSGFESTVNGQPCGALTPNGGLAATASSCWDMLGYSPFIITRYCTGNFTLGQLGIETFNGPPNDRILEVYSNSVPVSASGKNNLSSPLVPGTTYQLSFWAMGSSNVIFTDPMVVSVVSLLSYATAGPPVFPGSFNVISSFTVYPNNVWALYTNTFVFTSPASANHYAIGIGVNQPLTAALQSNPNSFQSWCFLDDVSLLPAPAATFVIPSSYTCGAPVYTNLAQYATPIPGTFSGPGVSSTTYSWGTQYDFNGAGLTGGTYAPIAFNYTTGSCPKTLWQTVAIKGIAPGPCDNGYTLTAVGFTTGTTYTWMPGNVNTPTFAVIPSYQTTYTLSTTNGTCQSTHTISLTNCCPLSSPSPYASSVLTTSLTGSRTILSDLTISSGATASLVSGDFLFAPDVSITVASGATLNIIGSHLRSCSNVMWDGIIVSDGGQVICSEFEGFPSVDNLIEDAKIAIDISNNTTSTITTILDCRRTIYNKNLIDIKLDNYQRTSATYSNVLNLKGNVFTCRDFTFTPTQWPQTLGASSLALSYVTSTTGLASPYPLQGAAIVALKEPFSSGNSNIAILFNEVGVTNGNTYYGAVVGTTASANNIFDSHRSFIQATNSNLSLVNNVFQNTLMADKGDEGMGSAVFSKASGDMTNQLLMSASAVSVGNRFWNCHYGVRGKKVYKFNIENALFRSTQAVTTSTANVTPGNTGILMSTNRLAYLILRNEFTNINNAINIPISANSTTLVTFTTCPTCSRPSGIFATHVAINSNTFSPGTGTGNFLNNAIDITCPNQASTWAINTATWITPGIIGINIEDNKIEKAYRGINVNGMQRWRTYISENVVSLEDDAPFNVEQYGINLSNSIATNTNQGRSTITRNTVTSVATNSLTDTQLSLIYSGSNAGAGIGVGISSPSVTCNYVGNGYNGFQFNNLNQGTAWYGNEMQNLARGMLLNNNGRIGTQGSSTFAMNNLWTGTWTSSTNYGIYTDNNTDASFSKLYVASSFTPAFPPNLFGNPNLDSYATYGPTVTSSGANYNCVSPTNRASYPELPNVLNFEDDDAYYIALTNIYRFLHMNDSLKQSSTTLKTFYDGLSGSSIHTFMRLEDTLMMGQFTSANSLLSSVSPTNNIDSYYYDYYTLYLSYSAHNFEHSSGSDSSSLWSMASQCPGLNGACVYQARALYNTVYHQIGLWPACPGSGARMANQFSALKIQTPDRINIYPNPSAGQLTVSGTLENEALEIEIRDLSGRLLITTTVKLKGFIANLELELLNGAYFVTITRSNHEQLTKKLLIAK